MRNDVTIVTALFNIEREQMDGRDWDEYLKWFEVTLQLKVPMTLFVTEDLVDFVKEKFTDKTDSDCPNELDELDMTPIYFPGLLIT